MTARDMARFGYLYLRKGRWGERQLMPGDWIARSTNLLLGRGFVQWARRSNWVRILVVD
jgi:CubicO group peptidase (beta-lactamase class C family)